MKSCEVLAIHKPFVKVCFLTAYCLLFTIYSFCQKANDAIQQGNEAYKKSDFATAIKDYTKALSADDKNAVAKFNMANAMQRTGDGAKANDTYDEAIKNAPDADLQAKAYYNKALSQLQQKNLQAAVDAFKQSLRLLPGDNDTRENLQKALAEMKQQNQKPDENQNPQPPQKQQQKPQPKMNQQMMEQKFKELQEQEKQLQKDLQKQKTNQPEQEKDW